MKDIDVGKLCPEMAKLRETLDQMGVAWRDLSHNVGPLQVLRTRYEGQSGEVSVIYGPFTYGSTEGHLEVWDFGKEPQGHLTAEPRTKCCTVCGQPFRTPAGNRKKCDKCRSAERVRKLPPRRCDECEREYQPKVHNSKYCSELCAGIAENKRRKAQRAAKSNSDE